MIVTRTPLRVSLFGGGSDLPAYYAHHDGMVVSTTINSFIYLAVNRCVSPHLRVTYSEMELVDDVEAIKHDRVRESLKHFEIPSNVEICSFSDIPVAGTGLGSSSSFTVGLISALNSIVNNRHMTPSELAELAAYIEIVRCGQPIGKQDQYAAAYGGFNSIHFTSSGVRVKPVEAEPHVIHELDRNLVAFDTGISRSAADVLLEQVENVGRVDGAEHTSTLVEIAKSGLRAIERGNVDDVGALLDHSWAVKRMIAGGISNQRIDEMYDRAMRNGALGGKILGAGGGGYLLLYVPERSRNRLLTAMDSHRRLNFKFYKHGNHVERV
jgi:D-glycero-alpha-D-manno-heptose-7-phosphate kinase